MLFINKNLKLTATELKNIPGNPLGKNQIGVFKATPALIKKLKNEKNTYNTLNKHINDK